MPSSALNRILALNALSCAGFGALFLLAPSVVAATVGDPPAWLLQAVGAGLLLNAVHLALTAVKADVSRRDAVYFAMGDGIWVAATIALIAAGLWITTTAGVVWAVAVALFVGGCGAMQWRLAPPKA